MKEETKYPAAERGYNEAIDLLKGFLVLSMILAHCIQFFGEEEKGLQKFIVNYVNLTTFSGFLFAYGFVCYSAYFTKNFKDVRRKMLQNAGRTLAAFYLSSIDLLFSMLSGNTGKNRILPGVKKYLKQTGSNSLFYLLMSNVFIFGFKWSAFHYKDIRYALIFYLVFIIGYSLFNLIDKQKQKAAQQL